MDSGMLVNIVVVGPRLLALPSLSPNAILTGG
jgi:hypothetical protein